jgi:hypothetical protein
LNVETADRDAALAIALGGKLCISEQHKQLESEVERLRAALDTDAAGAPVVELLLTAADLLRASGGGPVEDRLRALADTIDAAIRSSEALAAFVEREF